MTGVDREQLDVATNPSASVFAKFSRLLILATSAILTDCKFESTPAAWISPVRRNRRTKNIKNMKPYSRPSSAMGRIAPKVTDTRKPSGRPLGFTRQLFQALLDSILPPTPKTGMLWTRRASAQQKAMKVKMALGVVTFFKEKNEPLNLLNLQIQALKKESWWLTL